MAAATVTTTESTYMGNRAMVLATFTAINDAETWAPAGLTNVEACFLTNGANDVDVGATCSGGTVTFECAAAMANVKAIAIGT